MAERGKVLKENPMLTTLEQMKISVEGLKSSNYMVISPEVVQGLMMNGLFKQLPGKGDKSL